MNQESIIEALKSDIYTVIFKKVDGTIRNMRCTLKPDTIPLGSLVTHANHNITVWDVDTGDWRSFRVDSLQTMIKENSTAVKDSKIYSRIIKAWEQSVNTQATDLDTAFEEFERQVKRTSDDALMYLIYWNNGCSGPTSHPQIEFYKEELKRRGNPYNDDVANKIQEILEEAH